MRRIICIEDRNGEIVTIDDFNRPDNERVFRRKKLVPAFIARAHFVKDAVRDEPVKNFTEGGDRRQCFRPVSAGIDDLQRDGDRSFRRIFRDGYR